MHERDLLINTSPHQYGNGSISFIPHNRAWNNRTAMMTHKVWLMLLGLNLDLWTQPLVEKAVSSFGLLLIWEEDHYSQARALVRVRVSSLEDIPWFFVFTEGTHFESDCWAVQCEILQGHMLGAAPQDEDFPPDDDDFNPNNFFYHGYGQLGQGGPLAPAPQPAQPDPIFLNALGWGVWPNQQYQQAQQDLDEQAPNLIPMQQEPIQVQDQIEDSGGVIQAAVEIDDNHLLDEGRVLALDDITDSDDDLPPPLIDDEAQLPIFPNLQDIPQFQAVEDVQVEDLLGYVGQIPPPV